MTTPTHTLDTHHFALLDRIVQRLSRGTPVDESTRRAVSVLTAAADPARADRLAVQPGEPAVIVERMAAWALRRAPDEAVAAAAAVLDGHPADVASEAAAPAKDTPDRREALVPCP